jgi:hypothetical protein
MPLILKAAGNRIYTRNGLGQAREQLYGVQRWTYIKDRSEVADLFTFDFPEPCLIDGSRYIPAQRDEIIIYRSEADYDSDIRWFGGLLTDLQDKSVMAPNGGYQVSYTIQAQAFNIILDKELRQPVLANMTWGNLIKLLVQRHFNGQLSQTLDNIVNPVNAPPIRVNNGTMRELLRAMRTLTGYDFTVDAYKRLHVFLAAENPAPFELTDSDPGILIFDRRPEVRTESRQIFNIVRQPYKDLVSSTAWDGESFTAKGDPKGTGGRLPLLRTPATAEESIFIEEGFESDTLDATIWTETDDTNTHHPDYPNHGYLFPALGQLQILGGAGTLGLPALLTDGFHAYRENAYIVQEFQLTSETGEGYIAVFTNGEGLETGNIKAGLHVVDGALKALDGTTLVASLGLTTNYILWLIQTPDGWQYDILGGDYGTRQTLRTETGVTHLSDYMLGPILNKSLTCSINSFRYQTNELGIVLEIDGQRKTVGLERSSTDLPAIDAFLNTDETPAVLKFRAATAIGVIDAVTNDTQFDLATGQGLGLKTGHRLLVGTNILEAFDGQEAFVEAVSGDTVTLASPGLADLTPGQIVLANTTVPAKDSAILLKYSYERADEATVSDPDSIARFGEFPLTLPEKSHIRDFTSAFLEAQSNLRRLKDGILKISFTSHSRLIDEPDSLMALTVNLSRRPDPIQRELTIQRVVITPDGETHRYAIDAESADPVRPLDELLRGGHTLTIGSDGAIVLEVKMEDREASDAEDITVREVDTLFITLANPDNRRFGEFRLKDTWFALELEDGSGVLLTEDGDRLLFS